MNFFSEDILIIDDEPSVQDSVERALTKIGFNRERIHKAGGSREGCRLARNHKPATAIIDIDLDEDINGIGTAKLISGHIRNPPIFYSAFLDKYNDTIKTIQDYEAVSKGAPGWQEELKNILIRFQLADRLLFHRARVSGEVLELRSEGMVIVRFYSQGEEEVRAFPREAVKVDASLLKKGVRLIGSTELWLVDDSMDSKFSEEEAEGFGGGDVIDVGEISKGLSFTDNEFLDFWRDAKS